MVLHKMKPERKTLREQGGKNRRSSKMKGGMAGGPMKDSRNKGSGKKDAMTIKTNTNTTCQR
ncbi:hypothetical protein DPMN_012898 [Dreissena polymorpha]|uniref:Uncharacterized protein n=1 Tax=Dreissena polymorpha TaxID=45954 RepID=A0A9D4S1V6_DREPO|nr:hypothetical protein DPMN_012898 [Dreissena polymorpha]